MLHIHYRYWPKYSPLPVQYISVPTLCSHTWNYKLHAIHGNQEEEPQGEQFTWKRRQFASRPNLIVRRCLMNCCRSVVCRLATAQIDQYGPPLCTPRIRQTAAVVVASLIREISDIIIPANFKYHAREDHVTQRREISSVSRTIATSYGHSVLRLLVVVRSMQYLMHIRLRREQVSQCECICLLSIYKRVELTVKLFAPVCLPHQKSPRTVLWSLSSSPSTVVFTPLAPESQVNIIANCLQ